MEKDHEAAVMQTALQMLFAALKIGGAPIEGFRAAERYGDDYWVEVQLTDGTARSVDITGDDVPKAFRNIMDQIPEIGGGEVRA